LYLFGQWALIKLRLDDALDAIPMHMLNGIWGMISVGFFASPRRLEVANSRVFPHVGWFYSLRNGSADAHLLAAQIIGVLFILDWVMAIMLPFFIWLDWKGWFRSDLLEELVSLDTSYHGGLFLGSDNCKVNPEYISQFRKQRKDNLRRQHPSQHSFHSHEGALEGTDMEDPR
jgi:Amt family ammonium transporter